MILLIRKLLFVVFFNSSLFLMLIIGIQNNSNKSKVYFLKSETIRLPISFIFGASFISGSLAGSVLTLKSQKNNEFS